MSASLISRCHTCKQIVDWFLYTNKGAEEKHAEWIVGHEGHDTVLASECDESENERSKGYDDLTSYGSLSDDK